MSCKGEAVNARRDDELQRGDPSWKESFPAAGGGVAADTPVQHVGLLNLDLGQRAGLGNASPAETVTASQNVFAGCGAGSGPGEGLVAGFSCSL